MVREALRTHDIQYGAGGTRCQRVTAESGAVAAWSEGFCSSPASHAGADREAIGQRFCSGQNVRFDIFMLVGVPLARAAQTGLNLVKNQQPALPIAN